MWIELEPMHRSTLLEPVMNFLSDKQASKVAQNGSETYFCKQSAAACCRKRKYTKRLYHGLC
jgi:hypothetical protein